LAGEEVVALLAAGAEAFAGVATAAFAAGAVAFSPLMGECTLQ